ncbi:MAG TPA: MFS transporter [Thermoleophilaceae bacterium]|nr:MFS transporter [Thermoleophilaceae bacterium]
MTPHRVEIRELLGLRDFRLLFLGQGISVLGDRMVVVALAFAVLELGGSASEVGLVLGAAWAPLVLTVLVGGVVADRTSRRAVMVVADLVRLASQGLMAVLVITGEAEVWMLAALAGVTGAATGFFNPASTGFLPEVVPEDRLQPANALRSTGVAASEILGPLVAGVVVTAAGAGWAIAADAATFAASAACLTRLRPPPRRAREPSSFLGDLREGWVEFRSRRWVWTAVLYFAVGNLFWAAWSALGPVVAHRSLGGAAVWGTVLGAMGVGALAGSLIATRVRPRRPLVLAVSMEAVFSLPLAFLASGAPVPVLAFGTFLSGAGMMIGMSVWESTLQRHIPADSLSRVSAYDWFGSFVFFPLGLALWGSVAAAIGLHTSLWIAFGLMCGSACLLLSVPDVRNLPASRAEQPVA